MTSLDAIERLIEKATPGPWARDGEDSANFGVRGAPPAGNIIAVVQQNGRGGRWSDAAFIAHMRQLASLMLEVARDSEHALRHNCDESIAILWKSLRALDAYAQTLREEGE